MKKINVILLVMALLPLNTCFGKNIFTYSLQLLSPPPTIDNGKWVYPTTVTDPNKDYVYSIDLKTPIGYNGQIPSMRFTFALVNGKFSDGKTTMKISYDSLQLYKLHVKWNDISTPLADTAKISITNAYVVSDTANSSLQKGSIQKIVRKIASLKGQIPSLYAGPNRPINDISQIIASVNDMAYPGIYEYVLGVQTNKKVRQFQWILPKNWKTTSNQTDTFTTGLDIKQITVIPDYVTTGSIKVRGVNDIASAYSEYATQNFDRGFSFTTFPQSIVYGDNTAKTFAVPLFSGITYEWKVPTGWQINGQGNSLQGLNLNSVSITPSFCTQTDGKVQVRLIKGTNISDWHDCPYAGITTPAIPIPSSIYQYEDANFSISNISISNINTISWSGDGVLTVNIQGLNSKLVFTKSGLIRVNAAILLNGCSTPIVIPIDVSVSSSRLAISGTSGNSNTIQFNINYLTSIATISWTSSGLTPSSGSGTTYTAAPNMYAGAGYVRATITVSGNVFTLQQDLALNGYIPIDGPDQEYLSNKKAYFTMDESITVDHWTINGTTVYPALPNRLIVVLSRYFPGLVSITCTGISDYGTFIAYKCLEIIDDMSFFSLYPNPASDEVQVNMLDNSVSSLQTASVYNSTSTAALSVKVIDSYGYVVYSTKKADKQFSIPISKFKNGIYTVSISDGNRTSQKRLVVKH